MKKSVSLFLILALASAFGGCSSFSKSGRQERAYEKYVRKSAKARSRQQSKLSQGRQQLPPPQEVSEPAETVTTGE